MSLLKQAGSIGVALLLTICPSLKGQVPSLNSITPTGFQRGQSYELKVSGANLANPTGVWTNLPIKVGLPENSPENGKDGKNLTVRLEIPPDTAVGIGGLRVATQGGISNVRLFMVDDLPRIAEREGNNRLEQAHALELPCAVEGTMEAESWDVYKFQVQAGQRVTFEAVARRLGSPLDAQLRLLNGQGRELGFADDTEGLGQDARIHHVFKEPGTYYLEIRDVKYAGGGGHFYRIRIGDFPAASLGYPLGGQRGKAVQLVSAGKYEGTLPPLAVNVPADPLKPALAVELRGPGGKVTPISLHLSNLTESLEKEPNDQNDQATELTLPCLINGMFQTPNDTDTFKFTLEKGKKIAFETVSRELLSPCDLYMTILNAAGKELASNDDSGKKDARIEFTAPENGDYLLSVWDLNKRGGSTFVYRIRAYNPSSEFGLQVRINDKNKTAVDKLQVPQGGATMFVVRPVRRGYTGPIELEARNLPDGVQLSKTVIPAGGGDTFVTLQANKDVPLHGRGFQLVGKAVINDEITWRCADLSESLAAALGMAWPPLDLGNQVALGVTKPGQFSVDVPEKSLQLKQGETISVEVSGARQESFKEAIAITAIGLPKNVELKGSSIAADKPSCTIQLVAKPDAAVGQFSMVFQGTFKKDKTTITAITPAVSLQVQKK